MKCFAIFFAIVATAVAESEPWLGYGYGGYSGLGLGYGGAGLGVSGLGLGYGAGYAGGYGYAAAAPAAYAVAAPATYAAAAPVSGLVSTASVRTAPGVPTTSQFRKGDEYGNEAFGYNNPNSARSESGYPGGAVTGSYTNKATGTTINYVADAAGFRVIPGRKRRSAGVPAVRYEIKYNPGYAHGYFVIPALGY